MKTAVIAGGAGFLGSHLCDKLLSEGFKVICLDNLITGNVDNISHLAGNENFSFIKHDITNYIFVPGKVDYILHFASPASPVDYLHLPIQTLKVGSLGTHKALGLAKEKKQDFYLHQHQKFMVIRIFILNQKTTGEMLTQLDQEVFMMRLSDLQKQSRWLIKGIIMLRLE